ncbi:MAG: leucine-rich repeat protein [Christensenellaceae bacterium]|nr:leucine-rich repeat protein [Christensenellaceae bacterium]
MKKKFLLSLIVAILLSLLFLSSASAATKVASGTCGENITWTLDSEGTLTISGSGELLTIPDHSWKNEDYSYLVKEIVVEEGITSLPSQVFSSHKNLTSASLPESLKVIPENSFEICSKLYSVTFSSKLSSIEFRAFAYCNNLTSVSLPSTLSSLGKSAFESCKSLTSISLPSSLTSLGNYVFQDCSSLESITIPSKITVIPDRAFSGCSSLESVTFPSGITFIDNYAFEDCSSLSSVSLPSELTSLGYYSFSNCSSLTSIVIPSKVTAIGKHAFDGCTALKTASLPDSLTAMEEYVFHKCSSLETVNLPSSLTNIPASTFAYCAKLKAISIPETVTSIGDSAFDGCSGLESVSVPNNVTTIDRCAFKNCTSLSSVSFGNSLTSIGHRAFESCTVLSSIAIPESVATIDSCAFTKCIALESISIPKNCKVDTDAFENCTSLKKITAQNGVSFGGAAFSGCTAIKTAGPIGSGCDYEFGWTDSIPKYAFAGLSSLESISIPQECSYIGFYAFNGCSGLKKIVLKNASMRLGITPFTGCTAIKTAGPIGSGCDYEFAWTDSIPHGAFSGLTSLTSVTLPDSVSSIGEGSFENCSSLASITIPANLNTIGTESFSGCKSLTSVILPKSVTSVGFNAFKNCTGLTRVQLNSDAKVSSSFVGCSGLTSAGPIGTGCDYEFSWTDSFPQSAFDGLTNLKTLIVPDGLTSISSYTFRNCKALEEFSIPDGMTSIPSYAFYGCSSLSKVSIPNSVTSIERSAFYGCSSLRELSLPNDLNTISDYSFSYSGLQSVSIPKGITHIPRYAFGGCSSLYNISLPDTLTAIGKYAFYETNLKRTILPGSLTTIDDYAFAYIDASDFELHIPSSVVSIGSNCFQNCYGTLLFKGPYVHYHGVESDDIARRKCVIRYACHESWNGKLKDFKALSSQKIIADHTFMTTVSSPYVAPTYTSAGKTEATVCQGCGTSVTEQQTLPRLSFAAEGIGYRTVLVSWDKTEGADGYTLYRSATKSGGYEAIAILTGGDTLSYKDTGLSTNKVYYYKLKPYELKDGKRVYGKTSPADAARPLPAKVSGVNAKSSGYTSVKVTWNKVAGASGYTVYRSTTKSGGYEAVKILSGGSTLSFKDTGLTTGRKYYYKVKAYRLVDGKRVYGKASSADPARPLPGAVQSVSAECLSGKRLRITWAKKTGADGYIIARRDPGSTTFKDIATLNGAGTLSYTDSGLTLDAGYSYIVYGYVNYGGQTYRTAGSAREYVTVMNVPEKVSGVKVTQDDTDLVLTWDAVEGAAGYAIYRCYNKADGTYEQLLLHTPDDPSEPSFRSYYSRSGQDVYFKVKAYYEDEHAQRSFGKASDAAHFVTHPGDVTGVTATAAKKGSIKITWDAVDSGRGYKIYRSTTKSGGYKEIETIYGTHETSFTDTGLTPGKVYYYKVKAFDIHYEAFIYGATSPADAGRAGS